MHADREKASSIVKNLTRTKESTRKLVTNPFFSEKDQTEPREPNMNDRIMVLCGQSSQNLFTTLIEHKESEEGSERGTDRL